ncbi:MAG: hypothetical protein ACXACP_05865 [Candidatus Hodarchaeales archaeon]|jgi:predicted nucleotidyltransferase
MKETDFLRTLKGFLLKNYETDICSIILFGSLADDSDQMVNSTDIDTIIVLNDNCTFSKFKRIENKILAIQEYYWPSTQSFLELVLKSIRSSTGMFVNTFVCYRSDFIKRKFTNVFGVNPLAAKLLAPQSSVWVSIKNRHRVIWGEDIIKKWSSSLPITRSDGLKSFLLNISLSSFSLIVGVFKVEMCLYSMEAMKWSLFTWRNYIKLPIHNLLQIMSVYLNDSSLLENYALKQFYNYRKQKICSRYLLILAPIFILFLHHKLFKDHKMRT